MTFVELEEVFISYFLYSMEVNNIFSFCFLLDFLKSLVNNAMHQYLIFKLLLQIILCLITWPLKGAKDTTDEKVNNVMECIYLETTRWAIIPGESPSVSRIGGTKLLIQARHKNNWTWWSSGVFTNWHLLLQLNRPPSPLTCTYYVNVKEKQISCIYSNNFMNTIKYSTYLWIIKGTTWDRHCQ